MLFKVVFSIEDGTSEIKELVVVRGGGALLLLLLLLDITVVGIMFESVALPPLRYRTMARSSTRRAPAPTPMPIHAYILSPLLVLPFAVDGTVVEGDAVTVAAVVHI